MNEECENVIGIVTEMAKRYRISSITPLLDSVRTVARQDDISIAIMGRFKAGKSSFLNHFLERILVPVGVVPVTAVITEIGYGERERAKVLFLDGRTEEVAIDSIQRFIAEKENPENVRQVSRVEIELPELKRFRGLRFVDTPGLESALSHNTEVSLDWLPNVGLALLAVSIDTPLSTHDLDLLKNLCLYTPKTLILLTKADLLDDSERAEVLSFVREQLARAVGSAPQIIPYSVRSGYEQFKTHVEHTLVRETLEDFQQQRSAILERKFETLLRECADYLTLALKSAETIESERDSLKNHVIKEREIVDEIKSELRLVVQHSRARTRTLVAKHTEEYREMLEARLLDALESEFPKWTKNIRHSLESYEEWLRVRLTTELDAISGRERERFVAPLEKLKRQVFRSLQDFRERLSERTIRAFGVPLRTTETEIVVKEPLRPDIRIGRVFDRNWELLSPIIPIRSVNPLLKRHFTNKVPDMVEKNLSRLTSQWEESINTAMANVGDVAQSRLDELVETVERLITSRSDDAPQIRADLERINSIRRRMSESNSAEVTC